MLSVWFAGNRVGRNQVNRGDCWLWRMAEPDVWQPESEPLPDDGPDAVPAGTSTKPGQPSTVLQSRMQVAPGIAPTAPTAPTLADPREEFDRGVALFAQGRWDEAVVRFVEVFLRGPPDLRAIAAARLEEMGEVETF